MITKILLVLVLVMEIGRSDEDGDETRVPLVVVRIVMMTVS